jgi:hypothetical protein
MGLREIMNRSPKAGMAAAALTVAGALAVAVLSSSSGGPRPVGEGRAYFTIDDGKTWFADSASNPSPFTKAGKPAYRVFIWRCGTSTPFASHLYRSGGGPSTGGTARPTPAVAAGRTPQPMSGSATEVKRPGAAAWVIANTVEGETIARPQCPDGSTNGLEAVEP